jgi:hypothetical protein
VPAKKANAPDADAFSAVYREHVQEGPAL